MFSSQGACPVLDFTQSIHISVFWLYTQYRNNLYPLLYIRVAKRIERIGSFSKVNGWARALQYVSPCFGKKQMPRKTSEHFEQVISSFQASHGTFLRHIDDV